RKGRLAGCSIRLEARSSKASSQDKIQSRSGVYKFTASTGQRLESASRRPFHCLINTGSNRHYIPVISGTVYPNAGTLSTALKGSWDRRRLHSS
ncbi:MAG TPA: hypothetical protein VMZ04_06190, partial [Anaerolineae bacterium]|nr:hypothetical protein [Anaerolineae bacterium]